MVTALRGTDPATKVEAFARAPYPLCGEVCIGPRGPLRDPGRAVLREQRYDFSCGELLTRLDFEADDVRAQLEIVTLCSRTQPSLVLQETCLTVDRDCELTMSASMTCTTCRAVGDTTNQGCWMPKPEWADGRSAGAAWASSASVVSPRRPRSWVPTGSTARRSQPSGPVDHQLPVPGQAWPAIRLRQLTSIVPRALHSRHTCKRPGWSRRGSCAA